MKNNDGLVKYAKAHVGEPYWFGCYGQTATKTLLNSKKSMYPEYYTSSDFNRQIGHRVHDCVGLIKGYLWSDTLNSNPKYNSSQDKNAEGMYNASEYKGNINCIPNVNGVLVYKKSGYRIHHVGVYSTDGYVYEAKGHKYGVVKTKFNKSDWQLWSYCPYIKYGTSTKTKKTKKSNNTIADEVIAGKWGTGDDRKKRLQKAGYDYKAIQLIVNDRLGR